MNSTKKNIHFMGIGGSGVSAAAVLAKKYGFNVSGCNLSENSDYLPIVKREVKNIQIGHNQSHLKGIDLLVITPAVMFQSKDNEELTQAQNTKIAISWQEFLGEYLMKEKSVIAVAGTHGKSTTTALLSQVLENARLDPSVVIGAKIPKWETNYRFGKGKYFVIEADEFYGNFLHYKPEYLIINNIEFDHPDYFSNIDDVKNTFRRFIENLVGEKTLVANFGNEQLKNLLDDKKLVKEIKVISYKLNGKNEDFVAKITMKNQQRTIFKVVSRKEKIDIEFNLTVPGDFNVENSLGVIAMCLELGIDQGYLENTLNNFQGIGRRMELIGEINGVKVIDDYAHHPTALKLTLGAIKEKYPDEQIWCVYEPHSFSRTSALLPQYDGVFDMADRVIVGPIFAARDKNNFGVSSDSIINVCKHKNAISLDSIDKIMKLIKKDIKIPCVVVVMGAGESYLWAKNILKSLEI